ncbi:hypothetical protein [Halochromatium roseum]|uniref:hypothetical protein n=1 Tax=Halochromatium roseum TaxID=391920 RepID=UPI001914CA84|nr:hypothetical protein [Halochromatium roseum]MBK5938128.1 hypothetical protein [Halochromatium roseum]
MPRAKRKNEPEPEAPRLDQTLESKLKIALREIGRDYTYAVMLTRTRSMDGETSPFTSADIEALYQRFDEYNHRISRALASDDDETRRAEVEVLEAELGPLDATNEIAI